MTIGMDLGDKTSRYCMLDESGEVLRGSQRGDDQEGYGAGIRNNAPLPDGH